MINKSFISESTWWRFSKTLKTLQSCMVGGSRLKVSFRVRISNSGLIKNLKLLSQKRAKVKQ